MLTFRLGYAYRPSWERTTDKGMYERAERVSNCTPTSTYYVRASSRYWTAEDVTAMHMLHTANVTSPTLTCHLPLSLPLRCISVSQQATRSRLVVQIKFVSPFCSLTFGAVCHIFVAENGISGGERRAHGFWWAMMTAFDLLSSIGLLRPNVPCIFPPSQDTLHVYTSFFIKRAAFNSNLYFCIDMTQNYATTSLQVCRYNFKYIYIIYTVICYCTGPSPPNTMLRPS